MNVLVINIRCSKNNKRKEKKFNYVKTAKVIF